VSRIIAGLVGSLRLTSPAKVTRPTSDRVKESLFSSLESMDALVGTRVLDLFAGTAALGLEAISRGAKNLVAVEKSKAAADICQKNIDLVQNALAKQALRPEIHLINKDAKGFLKSNKSEFDLVLIDPPYEMTNDELAETCQLLIDSLAPGALVVVERSSREVIPELANFSLQSQKSYGDTAVYFFRARAQ